MNIQSTSLNSRPLNVAPRPQAVVTQPEAPTQDSVSFGWSGDDFKGAAVMGGIGLLGAAMGAAAGNYTGALAGVAGAVVGASAGATIAAHTPGEKLKTGMVLGAISGAIAGSTFGGTASAVVMGVAGATLPYGAFIGLASGWS